MAESLEEDIVVILADEALKPPFDLPGAHTPLGVGLCFGHSPDNALAEVFDFRHDAIPLKPDPHFGRLHVSAALPLLEKIARRHSGRVALELEGEKPRQVLSVDVNPLGD